MGDVKLDLGDVPVTFKDGTTARARSEGNNAAWHCACGADLPLLGRCTSSSADDCHTVCPDCGRTDRVSGDEKKRASAVAEL